MAEFALPKNSKIGDGKTFPAPAAWDRQAVGSADRGLGGR